jgi:hypothetical protein
MQKLTQTFNDGILTVYNVGNIASAGNKPKSSLTSKISNLRYEERVVGMSRYYIAAQAQIKVNHMLRVPRINSVSTQDVVIPADGKQYKIVQIQYIQDVEPPSMDLSLERVTADYDIA